MLTISSQDHATIRRIEDAGGTIRVSLTEGIGYKAFARRGWVHIDFNPDRGDNDLVLTDCGRELMAMIGRGVQLEEASHE